MCPLCPCPLCFQACLQSGPVTPDPAGTVTIICREEEGEALVYAVPPPVGTAGGLGREQP